MPTVTCEILEGWGWGVAKMLNGKFYGSLQDDYDFSFNRLEKL
jgi:hypothetical protein